MKPSRSEFVDINGLRIHVRRWGTPGAPRLFMLHGWMDCSATFQFLVDELKSEWDIVAPDWRGFGLSQWQHGTYWFYDYFPDLLRLIEHYSPEEPARIVGHSMGANIAGSVAGLRPETIARFVSLDAYGNALFQPDMEIERLNKWIAGRLSGAMVRRGYASVEEFAARLVKSNPRLPIERARFMADQFSQRNEAGQVVPAADPWHAVVSPLQPIDSFKAHWKRITASVLWVIGEDSYLYARFKDQQEEYRQRLACFRQLREVNLPDVGHNMQHEVPQLLAPLIEDFLTG
jgi:pimeloyl-ACP methyl ester carboxylesterase